MTSSSPPTPQRLQGERRVITMLFSDVADSTALAANFDPEEWAEIMNEAFSYLLLPVERYGGTVARLMGDGILAFFGAPVAHEDDPQRAILAGLDIISGINDFRREFQADYSLDFNVRVGINTGPVVVGEIGGNVAQEYTAMGDAINLASRMESTATPGTVQISEATYRLVAPLFDVWEVGDIEVKGKEGPVRAYRVLGPADRPGRLRGIQGIETSLIGRQGPFEQLRQAVNRLREGQGAIIFLVGEAGLGKSRLLEELRLHCQASSEDGDPPIRWLVNTASSIDKDQPYGTLRHQMRQALGIRERNSAEGTQTGFEHFLGAIPADMQPRAQEIFATILNMPPATEKKTKRLGEWETQISNLQSPNLSVSQSPTSSPRLQLGDESFKHELYTFVLEILRRQVEQGGMTVQVIDDLHWVDAASAELFQHLLQLVPGNPILNLMAMRPERDTPGWQLKAHALEHYPGCSQEIILQPLTIAESALLVDQLLRVSALPAALRETILSKADGNPFFLEEIVRALMDKGFIIRTAAGDGWQLAEGVAPAEVNLAVPGNIGSLLAARIDRLDAATRETLQQAAVIGRTFDARILAQLSPQPERLPGQLQTLQGQDFILPARGEDGTYRFRHELTRDAAYASILHRQRRRFHRRVGEILEQLYDGQSAEQAPALAHHFEQARDDGRALHYYTLAADTAAALYANREAAEHYHRAITITQRLLKTEADIKSKLLHLYTRYGRILELLGRYDEALENYSALEALGQALDAPDLELAAIVPQATIYATPTTRADPERAEALSHRALALAEESGDYAAEARSYWNLMLTDQHRGRYGGRALDYGIRALAIARNHHLRETRGYILLDLGRAYGVIGFLKEAEQTLREAIHLWRELDNRPLLADSLATLAQGMLMDGRPQEGIPLAEEALEIAHSIGNRWGQSFASYNIALLYEEVGRFSEAFAAFLAAERLGRGGGFAGPGSVTPLMLTIAYGYLGAPDYQRDTLDRLLDEAEKNKNRTMHLVRPLVEAQRILRAGQPKKAYAIIEPLYEQMRQYIEPGTGEPLVSALFAMIALEAGHPSVALEAAEELLQQAQETGNGLYLPDLLYFKARALRVLGRLEEGKAFLRQAAEEARRQTSRRSLWFILADLYEIALAEGNEEEAAHLAAEGRDVVNFVAEHLTADPELRKAFLSLPSVQTFFKH